jgi:WD40 repeat protein
MQLLTGYAKPITALAITADGSRLYSVAEGQQMVWEWDLDEQKVLRKIRCGHRRPIAALALTPEGDFLLTVPAFGALVVLALESGEIRSPGHWYRAANAHPAVAVSRDGRLAASSFSRRGQGHGYLIWDIQESRRTAEITGHDRPIHDIAFSSGEMMLGTASSDGMVRLWDFPANTVRHVLRPPVIPKLIAFRPDGRVLATAGGRSVFLHDTSTGELLETLKGQKGNVTGLAYSPDGRYLASVGLDGVIFLRDAGTHEVVGQRFLDLGKLSALVWRADSSGVIVGGARLIAVCDLQELLVKEQARPRPRGEPLSISGHARKVEALAYSRDGRLLASQDKRSVRIWDLSAGAGQARERLTFPSPGYDPQVISWSPDGSKLNLTFSVRAYIYDTATGALMHAVPAKHRNPMHLSFTPAGRVLLVVRRRSWSDPHRRLSLRDPQTDEPLFEATGEAEGIKFRRDAAVFGADDQRIYLVLGTHTVSRWNVLEGTVEPVIRQKAGISGFSARLDERLAVTLGGNSALVWNLPDGSRKFDLKHPLLVSGAAFIPGERLLTTCYDGLVRVWDLFGGAEVHAWDLGMGKIYSLAVSPDDMTFAAGVEKKSRIVLMDVPD